MATIDLPPSGFSGELPFPSDWSLAQLQEHLGGIPIERIRLFPFPGCATEADADEINACQDRLYELVDGTLVEKPMGWIESILAGIIFAEIRAYLKTNSLGKVVGESGSLRILPGLIRIPDVSFISWKRLPQKLPPRRPIPALVPELAVEVISETNTAREIQRKIREYFKAGVVMVWEIDPKTRSARIYTSPADVAAVPPDGCLTAADILPGLSISLRESFAEAELMGPPEPLPPTG
ncbi:MAG: Uma2 family endonuclease [Planctomycetia bacterium]|nr:Uma2 family endonuclease [Planctomycetia bacterium]